MSSSSAASKKRQRAEEAQEAAVDDDAADDNEQAQDDVDALPQFSNIEELQEAGIAAADITRLRDAGYLTMQDIAYAPLKHLLEVKGVTETKANRILTECKKRVSMGFTTGTEISLKRRARTKITTGSRELDKLLGGGLETSSITEISGEFGSGKSQLCFQMCVTCQLPKAQGGGEGRALYIDTEGSFAPERIEDVAKRYGLDPESVLGNVTYARAFNTDHQLELLQEASKLMGESQYALVVVDSSMGLYRLDYDGRGELNVRQRHLGQFLRKLLGLCDTYGVAALLTNQVTSVVDGTAMFGPQSKPIGGHVMGHAATTRIGIRKGRGAERKCKINDSPHLPGAECVIRIYEGGIGDAE